MLADTPLYSCEIRECRCHGSDPERLRGEENRCLECGHPSDKHQRFAGVPIIAKLFLTGRTIVDAICLHCGEPVIVADRLTAGVTGQQTYAYGAVLSHLRGHGIETQLSPLMLAELTRPVAYFVLQY